MALETRRLLTFSLIAQSSQESCNLTVQSWNFLETELVQEGELFREASLKSHHSNCQLCLNTEPGGAGVSEHSTCTLLLLQLLTCAALCPGHIYFVEISEAFMVPYRYTEECAVAELLAKWGLGNLHGDMGRTGALKSDFTTLGLRSGSSISSAVLDKATNLLKFQFYHLHNVTHTAYNPHRILVLLILSQFLPLD